jgi:hypothetical protein
VIKNQFPIFLLVVAVCSPLLAQSPAPKPSADKPMTQGELLDQLHKIDPLKDPAATLSSGGSSLLAPTANSLTNPEPLLNGLGAGGDILKPQAPRPSLPGTNPATGGTQPGANGAPGAKPPTEITALEATLDQKTNIAVFIGNVFVKDPQFNVDCDKLTAYLKHDDKNAKADPKGAAPKAATPKPATPAAKGAPAPGAATKKQSGGLDKAIAITTSDRKVKITQDKVEADGSITHGIGFADRAEYFSTNGDIYLYGMPDVTSGTNRCIATAPETWMKLNRDGSMEAHGPHKTFIVDNSNDRDSKGAAPQ